MRLPVHHVAIVSSGWRIVGDAFIPASQIAFSGNTSSRDNVLSRLHWEHHGVLAWLRWLLHQLLLRLGRYLVAATALEWTLRSILILNVLRFNLIGAN